MEGPEPVLQKALSPRPLEESVDVVPDAQRQEQPEALAVVVNKKEQSREEVRDQLYQPGRGEEGGREEEEVAFPHSRDAGIPAPIAKSAGARPPNCPIEPTPAAVHSIRSKSSESPQPHGGDPDAANNLATNSLPDPIPVDMAIGGLSLGAAQKDAVPGLTGALQTPTQLSNMHMHLTGGLNASLQLQAAMQHHTEDPISLDQPGWNMGIEHRDAQEILGTAFSDVPQPDYDAAATHTHAAFAKLEFNDGAFYMTTYAVELGRDMRAFKLAKQHAMETEIQNKERNERSNSGDKPPETPARQIRSAGHASVARSFVSESGGVIGEDDDLMPVTKRKRRKSQKSKSDESADSQVFRKNSLDVPDDPLGFQTLPTGTVDPNVTARLDPAAHMGDPNYIPLIPIHPPNLFSDPKSSGKGISRKHVKIAYNFDTGKFEMHVFGRNGAFLDGKHYQSGAVVPLKDGSVIQIGGVPVRFLLPNQLLNDDGEPEPSESVSGRMSFSFEDGQGGSVIASDSGSPDFHSPEERLIESYENGFQYEEYDDESEEQSVEEDAEDEDDDEEEEEDEEFRRPAQRIRLKTSKAMQKQPDPPRRGPGRPPGKKTVMKLKLKMGKTQYPDRPTKTRDKENERRASAQKSVKSVPKPGTKDFGEKKPKSVSKQSSKEPAKEPAKESATPETKPVRVARDEMLQNGVGGINIKDLPPGFVIPPRKKGPGRPPKDGIMSKRERQLLLKAAKEHEKALRLGLDPSLIPPPDIKPKSAPRRNSKGEVIEGDTAGVAGKSNVGTDEKGERVSKPPRSPSPEMRIEDYSEEQLQRPTANYVVLIHDAISNSKTKKLNLQQIYSAIERRWPFFKFKVTSNGWQSSVRHNLGQHPAFKQVEKDGKGWLWGITEGVPIERERKKKASPPPHPPHSHHQGPYGAQQYPFGGFQAARPGFGAPPGLGPPGQYQPIRPPTFVPPTVASQSAAAKQSTYSSPYDNGLKTGGTVGTSSNAPHGLPTNVGGLAVGHNQVPLSSRTPSAGQPYAQPPKYQQPSQDLIETFRKVFVGTSIAQANGGMDEETATRIVDNAIKRVLEPESMIGVPLVRNELAVKQAFESCLQRSSGPPKRISPGEPMPVVGSAKSMAQSAAINATVPAGTSTTSAAPPALASSVQGQSEPERPAAANLMAMLTGTSKAPIPPPKQNHSATSSSNSTALAKPNGVRPPPIDIARANGTGSPMRPVVEPLTPPAAGATPHALTSAASAISSIAVTSQQGSKRAREATIPEGVDETTKKLKTEE